MNRNYISLFFSLVFIISVVAPSILYITDNTEDIIVINITEEENKEKEATKDLEIKILEISNFNSLFADKDKNKHHFCLNSYSDLYHGITLPPPESV